jgi:hypothetical protein
MGAQSYGRLEFGERPRDRRRAQFADLEKRGAHGELTKQGMA